MAITSNPHAAWTPSIIIGRKPGAKIPCGPHGTPFTANGIGWCYGQWIDNKLVSMDFRTGRNMALADVLPSHDDFTVFAGAETGLDLISLDRHIKAITSANNAVMCSQAMLANPVTIELSHWGISGAPEEIAKSVQWHDIRPTVSLLVRRDGRPITSDPPMRKSAEVHLTGMHPSSAWFIDIPDQILWITPEVIPLIDCPGMTFDHDLRSQLKAAFPHKKDPWAIVSYGSSERIISESRMRETGLL